MLLPHLKRFSAPWHSSNHRVVKTLDEYVKALDSLEQAFRFVGLQLEELITEKHGDISKFCNEFGVKDENLDYKIPIEKYDEYQNLLRVVGKTGKASALISRSLLVELISQFDVLLIHLIRDFMLLRPERVKLKEPPISVGKTISFKDLVSFSSIEELQERISDEVNQQYNETTAEELKDSIISKITDQLMRQSHTDQIKGVAELFAIKLPNDGQGFWADFIEITERRNLFTHTNGVVSKQYLGVCEKHQVVFSSIPAIGDQLEVDQEYFSKAYKCFYETGVRLAHEMWRKILENQVVESEENLVDITLNLIRSEQYRLAIKLCEFAAYKMAKDSTAENMLTKTLNLAQAYKWSGNNEKCREILGQKNWGSSYKFQLGEDVLRDEYDRASLVMKQLGHEIIPEKNPIDSEEAYRTWPIFREFRKTEQFREAFREIFNKEFEIVATKED